MNRVFRGGMGDARAEQKGFLRRILIHCECGASATSGWMPPSRLNDGHRSMGRTDVLRPRACGGQFLSGRCLGWAGAIPGDLACCGGEWSRERVGFVMTTAGLAGLPCGTPAGAVVDRLGHPRLLMAAAVGVVVIGTLAL